MKRILLDTGPWVAFIDRNDSHHAWAKAAIDELHPPLVTCEAVVAEACFLTGGARSVVLEMLATGAVEIDFSLGLALEQVRKLMSKYSDVPMSFADACLVQMANVQASRVLTVDSDFRIYRTGRRALELIAPFA